MKNSNEMYNIYCLDVNLRNHLNYIDYNLQGCNEPWYCLSSTNTLFPFGNQNNQNFRTFIDNNNTVNNNKKKKLKLVPCF